MIGFSFDRADAGALQLAIAKLPPEIYDAAGDPERPLVERAIHLRLKCLLPRAKARRPDYYSPAELTAALEAYQRLRQAVQSAPRGYHGYGEETREASLERLQKAINLVSAALAQLTRVTREPVGEGVQ